MSVPSLLETSKILILWRGKSKLKAHKMRFLRSTLQYRKREGERGEGREGGKVPSQRRSKYRYISDARDNYRKEWIGHVPKMEEVTRIPKLFMAGKSVANVDLGHPEKRWGISTPSTTHISINKLKQKTSKPLLHLYESQTEAELLMSL